MTYPQVTNRTPTPTPPQAPLRPPNPPLSPPRTSTASWTSSSPTWCSRSRAFPTWNPSSGPPPTTPSGWKTCATSTRRRRRTYLTTRGRTVDRSVTASTPTWSGTRRDCPVLVWCARRASTRAAEIHWTRFRCTLGQNRRIFPSITIRRITRRRSSIITLGVTITTTSWGRIPSMTSSRRARCGLTNPSAGTSPRPTTKMRPRGTRVVFYILRETWRFGGNAKIEKLVKFVYSDSKWWDHELGFRGNRVFAKHSNIGYFSRNFMANSFPQKNLETPSFLPNKFPVFLPATYTSRYDPLKRSQTEMALRRSPEKIVTYKSSSSFDSESLSPPGAFRTKSPEFQETWVEFACFPYLFLWLSVGCGAMSW